MALFEWQTATLNGGYSADTAHTEVRSNGDVWVAPTGGGPFSLFGTFPID